MGRTAFLILLMLGTSLFLPSCRMANGGSQDKKGESDASPSLQKALKDLVEDKAMKNGRIGFFAKDLDSDGTIASHRPLEGMTPASTQKLISSLAALEILGPEHRFRTVLGYRGSIEEGSLKGDLILRGGGDPALLSEEFPEHYGDRESFFGQLISSCKEAGIERIEGRVLADAHYFPYNTLSRGRIWEDMGNYFGAFPSGLNIMDNAFELRFRTPGKAGKNTEILSMDPKVPWMRIENHVKSSQEEKDQAYIYGKPYDRERIVEGTLPAGRDSYEIEGSLPDPARTAAWMLRKALEGNGIPVSEKASTFRREGIEEEGLDEGLDTIRSPKLRSIVQKTNFESKNLFAESLLLEIGKDLESTAKPRPSGKKLLERIEKWGIDPEGMRLEDGSGLAPTNRVSTKFLVEVLERAWKGEHRKTIKNSLPVAGKSGTMSYVGAGTKAEGRIWAKSGYMSGVRTYAGYAKAKDGTMRAFAFIANGFSCSASDMRRNMEEVMVELVD